MDNRLTDGVKMTGFVTIELRDDLGFLKDKREIKNLVVTTGKNHIADQLSASPGQSAMSHMEIGVGTTGAQASDTGLESPLDRNALSSRTDTNNVVTYVANWAAGDGTGAITEAGIFNAAVAGTMLARTTFSVVNKGATDTLQVSWALTIG